MLTVLKLLTSFCRACGPDSSSTIGSCSSTIASCLNGFVSVGVVSLLEPLRLISIFSSSRNGHVLGLFKVDGVSLLEPSGVMN